MGKAKSWYRPPSDKIAKLKKTVKALRKKPPKHWLHMQENCHNEMMLRRAFKNDGVDHPYFLSGQYGKTYFQTEEGTYIGVIFDQTEGGAGESTSEALALPKVRNVQNRKKLPNIRIAH